MVDADDDVAKQFDIGILPGRTIDRIDTFGSITSSSSVVVIVVVVVVGIVVVGMTGSQYQISPQFRLMTQDIEIATCLHHLGQGMGITIMKNLLPYRRSTFQDGSFPGR